MKEEKIEDISGDLHSENFGICAFSSLQKPQQSRLLQVCSFQPALQWKSAAFNCRCTLFNNLSCLPWHTSPHNDYGKKKPTSLFTPLLHLQNNSDQEIAKCLRHHRGCFCFSTTSRLIKTATHQLTGTRQGCVRKPSFWILHILYWGSWSKSTFKQSTLPDKADGHFFFCHILSVLMNVIKPEQETQAFRAVQLVHSTGGTACTKCTSPDI